MSIRDPTPIPSPRDANIAADPHISRQPRTTPRTPKPHRPRYTYANERTLALPRTQRVASSMPNSSNSPEIPEDLAIEIRRLAHDLSNSLEIIVQTSYLLSMAELKEPASDWLRMLDSGVTKALDINLELRNYIKKHTT